MLFGFEFALRALSLRTWNGLLPGYLQQLGCSSWRRSRGRSDGCCLLQGDLTATQGIFELARIAQRFAGRDHVVAWPIELPVSRASSEASSSFARQRRHPVCGQLPGPRIARQEPLRGGAGNSSGSSSALAFSNSSMACSTKAASIAGIMTRGCDTFRGPLFPEG